MDSRDFNGEQGVPDANGRGTSELGKGVQGTMMASANSGRQGTGRPRGTWRAAGLVGALCGLTTLAGCHSQVTEGRAASYLIIDALEASRATGGTSTTFTSTLQSDVLTKNSVFEDPGRVTMRLGLKDITSTTGPTSNNHITISRYRVEFRRTDGRNREGVDVPYSFEGASTFTVGNDTVTAGFVLVRVQAKLEAPLITLVGYDGGALVISTLADVTFFGKDQTGTDVTVKGTISVNFADWGDPEN